MLLQCLCPWQAGLQALQQAVATKHIDVAVSGLLHAATRMQAHLCAQAASNLEAGVQKACHVLLQGLCPWQDGVQALQRGRAQEVRTGVLELLHALRPLDCLRRSKHIFELRTMYRLRCAG